MLSPIPCGHQFTYLRKGSAASLINLPIFRRIDRGDPRFHASGVSLAISTARRDRCSRHSDWPVKPAPRYPLIPTSGSPVARRSRARRHQCRGRRGRPCQDIARGRDGADRRTGPGRIAAIYLARAPAGRGHAGRRRMLRATAERSLHSGAPGRSGRCHGRRRRLYGRAARRTLRRTDFFRAARFANAAAALSTLGYGAVAPLPGAKRSRRFWRTVRPLIRSASLSAIMRTVALRLAVTTVRHDRGVDHPQPPRAVDPAVAIDDRHLVEAHAARTTRVVRGLDPCPGEGVEVART